MECIVNLSLGRELNYNNETILDIEDNRVSLLYLPFARPGIVHKENSDVAGQIDGVNIILERYKAGDIIENSKTMFQMPFYITFVADNKISLIEKLKNVNKKLVLQSFLY